jgi:antitoxin VapB
MANLPSITSPQVSDNVAPFGLGPPAVAPMRHARLFRNGANQAVRIPKEFELPGKDVIIRQEGKRLVIEVVEPQFKKGSPQAMLAMLDEMAQLEAIDEDVPDADAGMLPLDAIELGDIDEVFAPPGSKRSANLP